jgi:hypothetical protein
MRRCMAAASLLLAMPGLRAQSQYPPLQTSNFTLSAPQGFGDRQNSWAWSMAWFNGKLLVGTNRAEQCVTSAAEALGNLGAYPPSDPSISCTANPNDLPLQAEIWSWNPATNAWTRVFQSPQDVPIPGTNPVKYVARDIGFRGMNTFTEPDGTQALYVGGCSSLPIHPGVPGGRLLRSTDGLTFTPVLQDAGSFLGDLGNACFRGIDTFNNKLIAVAGSWKGMGVVVESANPKQGDNAFQQISPANQQVYEIAPFNGALYVTFVDETNGFSVAKTNGLPPYVYTTVLPNGGYRQWYPNPIALSMQVFQGRLYVGGDGIQRTAGLQAQGAELFRINPDDSWDLLSGQSRNTPVGQKNALSGLGIGLGWQLNDHMWRMRIYDGRLYIGTFDAATSLRIYSSTVRWVTPEMGFDLWWTADGTYFTLVDQTGFGDEFNIGVRTLMDTPYGLFLGTANDSDGLKVYRAVPATMGGLMLGRPGSPTYMTSPDPPQGLQLEGKSGGPMLLSWNAPLRGGAVQYHIYRWTFDTHTGIAPSSPADGPVAAPVAYQDIGVTTKTYYSDNSVSSNYDYAYVVEAQNAQGTLSGPSNYVSYPANNPPPTFLLVLDFVRQLAANGKFTSLSAAQQIENLVIQAQSAAQQGNFSALLALWNTIQSQGTQLLPSYLVQDLTIAVSRLVNRTQLVQGGLLPLKALQQ